MAVLIKGQSIKCGQQSRDHFLRGAENEHIEVIDVTGFATRNADEALQMIEFSAKGTKCLKPVYSAKINPETDRLWAKEEVIQAITMLETNLGLTDHARVIIEHLKKGRVHYHVLWDRRPIAGGPVKHMGNDYAIIQKTQREIEKVFKLRPMMAKGRNFRHWEVEWAKRYGHDIFELREQITTSFNGSKNGQSFMSALKAKGIVLCKGDKSQFVIILPWGQHKALSSMIHGRPTKAVLRRALADIDIKKLPTVSEGKQQVSARLTKAKPRRNAVTRPITAPRRAKSLRVSAGANTEKARAGSNQKARRTKADTNINHPRSDKTTANTIISTVTTIAAVPKLHHRQAKDTGLILNTSPIRPPTNSGICAEQSADLIAAYAGKITWSQYFMKWGNGGLSLP